MRRCRGFLATEQAELDFSGVGFADPRLRRRFRAAAGDPRRRLGASIPYACQGWAAVKAAYRFLPDPRVSEAEILAGHFEATRRRPHDLFDVLAEGVVNIAHRRPARAGSASQAARQQ